MGYYSNFYGYARSKEVFSVAELRRKLEEISGYSINFETDGIDDENITDNTTEFYIHEVKWYNCEEDIINLSKLYPDIEFFITRYGEDATDMTEFYIKNGKWEARELQILPPKWENEEINKIFIMNRQLGF